MAPGVLFDSVLVVAIGGTQTVVDLTSGAFTLLASGAVQVAGNMLSVDVPATLLAPSTFNAVTPADCTWNLWRRHTFNPANDNDISDFAPDNSNLAEMLEIEQPYLMPTRQPFDGDVEKPARGKNTLGEGGPQWLVGAVRVLG